MRPFRLTLSGIMLIVVVLGVDFGIFRLLFQNQTLWTPVLIGLIPAAHVLSLHGFRVVRRGGTSGSLGFQIFGWSTLMAFLAAFRVTPNPILFGLEALAMLAYSPLRGLLNPAPGQSQTLATIVQFTVDLGVVTVFFSVPVLIVACAARRIARKVGFSAPVTA